MSTLWTRFRTVATFLWLVVALLLAFNIGAMFALSPPQVTFVLIAATGIVVLVSINWPTKKHTLTVTRLSAGEKILLSATAAPTNPTQEFRASVAAPPEPSLTPVQRNVHGGTKTLFPEGSPEKLGPNEARLWLDDFLRKQQHK